MPLETVETIADFTNEKLQTELESSERKSAEVKQLMNVRRALESQLADSLIKAQTLGSKSSIDNIAAPLARTRAEIAEAQEQVRELDAQILSFRAEQARRRGEDAERQRAEAQEGSREYS